MMFHENSPFIREEAGEHGPVSKSCSEAEDTLDTVKNVRARLPVQYCPSDCTTWMGDTHVETSVLPSSRLFRSNEDD